MKTLDEWADERRQVDDLRPEFGYEFWPYGPQPGYTYPGGCYIEIWPDKFYLLIENQQWTSRSLERLEGILYECWPKSELAMQEPGV